MRSLILLLPVLALLQPAFVCDEAAHDVGARGVWGHFSGFYLGVSEVR
jgi:hypothetical protein